MEDETKSPWRGEGSIRKVTAGRHKGRWRLQWVTLVHPEKEDGTADETRRAPQRVDRLFAKRGDAIQWRDAEKARLRAGAQDATAQAAKARAKAPPSVLTFQGMFDALAGTRAEEYRDGIWVKNGSTPQTVLTKAYRWRRHVEGTPIAARPMKALTRDDARAWVEAAKRKGTPVQTIRDVVGVMKQVAFSAVDERPECRSLANPFLRLAVETEEERALRERERATREAVDGPRLLLLSPDAAREGLARLTDPKERAMLALHLLGGLRSGERMALCAEQIDLRRGVAVIDRAVRLGAHGQQYVGMPKRNRIRLVALCPTLAGILRARVEDLPPDRAHLFGQARRDEPEMVYQARERWAALVARAELPEAFVPKGGRASHNNWVEKLCPSVSLSTRLEHMGHSLGKGDGQPLGLRVNLANYTGHIPEAYDILRAEIERVAGASA